MESEKPQIRFHNELLHDVGETKCDDIQRPGMVVLSVTFKYRSYEIAYLIGNQTPWIKFRKKAVIVHVHSDPWNRRILMNSTSRLALVAKVD